MYQSHIFNLARLLIVLVECSNVSGFWDTGTTTYRVVRSDEERPRTSFFRWQWVSSRNLQMFFYGWDWEEIERRRRLFHVAGISIEFIPLSTAVILNRRALLTSYNYLDPYMNRQQELRIWALGRAGLENTPYRYRVWVVHRLVPWSLNPEHCHGPRCTHQPRHDVSIIISRDMMYIYPTLPHRWHYAYRALLPPTPYTKLDLKDSWMAGSGYEYMQHVQENYKIFYHMLVENQLVDCSTYIPKWWGKFICFRNTMNFPGVQNGGGYFNGHIIFGLGCFEIRYNEERIFAFTDLRYYFHKIKFYAHLTPGQYYEYAYPQWGMKLGIFAEDNYNTPWIPDWQLQSDAYPLG